MECPICKQKITKENSVIKNGKEIVSSIPVAEDAKYIKYLQRSIQFRYYCCKTCDRQNNIVEICNKIFYYIGLGLIVLGFVMDLGVLSLLGAGSIFIGLVITFGIPAITKRYPNVMFKQAKESGALVLNDAFTATESASISGFATNVPEVETNMAKSQEVSASSEQVGVVNSEFSEQEATSNISESQIDDKKYFSKMIDFGEYGTVEFVDLGLSSGTLWSTRNLGAQEVYLSGGAGIWVTDELLPTYEQCQELIAECDFATAYLQAGDNSFVCVSVTGPNGNVIYLPLDDSEEFGCLAFISWTRSEFSSSMGAFMLIETKPLFGPFINLSDITIGMSQKGVNRSWRYVLPK